MRLAACYTLFNGTELLERSADQIKDHVDFIILGSQDISNAGNEMDEYDFEYIKKVHIKLNAEGLCYLTDYRPNLGVDRKENERRKLQRMLEFAKSRGATHWILLAADHFYTTQEFKRMKEKTEKMDIDVTLTKMYTYYKKPTWRLDGIEDYYMPFICKLNSDTKVVKENKYPFRVDPSVRVDADTFHAFDQSDIMLHHYSMVRTDIEGKFRNAAAGQNWSPAKTEHFLREHREYSMDNNCGIDYFGGLKLKEVVDIFSLQDIVNQ